MNHCQESKVTELDTYKRSSPASSQSYGLIRVWISVTWSDDPMMNLDHSRFLQQSRDPEICKAGMLAQSAESDCDQSQVHQCTKYQDMW